MAKPLVAVRQCSVTESCHVLNLSLDLILSSNTIKNGHLVVFEQHGTRQVYPCISGQSGMLTFCQCKAILARLYRLLIISLFYVVLCIEILF